MSVTNQDPSGILFYFTIKEEDLAGSAAVRLMLPLMEEQFNKDIIEHLENVTRAGDIYSSTQSIVAQETEQDEVYWDESDEEWYNVHEFVQFIHDRTIHWDWGGIARIRVDGKDTNYHVGQWMAAIENENSISIRLEDLVKFEQEVLVEWVNK